jgi:hypothetical protein
MLVPKMFVTAPYLVAIPKSAAGEPVKCLVVGGFLTADPGTGPGVPSGADGAERRDRPAHDGR